MSSVCWQITFLPDIEPSEKFLEFLEVFFEVTAQNYNDSGQDEYIGYLGNEFNETQMLKIARQMDVKLPTYQINELKSENWLKDYVIEFPPFEVADFCIYGIHETTIPQTSKIPLQIYAATAFGSNHPTTQSCINALSELHSAKFNAQHILDIGTGSGILSLCAAKLWDSAKIIASDIDDEAVIVTNSNAQTNQLNNRIETIISDGYKNPIITSNKPYDLILSNILANPLISFAHDLADCLIPQGYCILSGFIEEQINDVVNAYTNQGLKLIKIYSHENWRSALMQKV